MAALCRIYLIGRRAAEPKQRIEAAPNTHTLPIQGILPTNNPNE